VPAGGGAVDNISHMPDALEYLNALVIAAAAVGIRWLLVPLVGPDAPYATILGAVALTVWMWGWGPAVLTAVAGLIGTGLAIGRPLGTLPVDQLHMLVGLSLYTLTCGLIIGLGEEMRRTRDAYWRSQERFLGSQEAAIQGYCWLNPVRDAGNAVVDFRLGYINPLGAAICKSSPQLLDASRIDRGRLGSKRETVRLNVILDAAVEPRAPTLWRSRTNWW